MLGKIFQIKNTILKVIENKTFKRIMAVLGIIILIVFGLFNIWKDTHNDLQTNTGEIIKIFVCMDLGLSEEDSEKIISDLTEDDNSKIDNILNKYIKGLKIIDKLSELEDFNNIRDILSEKDIADIQNIYRRYVTI